MRIFRYTSQPQKPISVSLADATGYDKLHIMRQLTLYLSTSISIQQRFHGIMTETIKLVYQTAKVRLGFLIMLCAMVGAVASPSIDLTVWQMTVMGLAVLLCSSCAGAFNQLYERDIDAKMKRTSSRTFATGRFEANNYWQMAIVLLSLFAILAVAVTTNVEAAFRLFLGSFCYGVVYTVWLKRRTWWNVVIGGLAGSFAVMVGAASVGASASPAPIIFAVVLFLWTPPHFWALAYACKADYAAANIPMLPVLVSDKVSTWVILLHAVPLVLLSLALGYFGMGWIYMLGAFVGGTYFIWESIKLVREPCIKNAWRTFAASIVQLGLMLTMAILDRLILG